MKLFFILFICFGGVFSAEAVQESFYCNARFGFRLSYPASFEMDPPPANDDGRIFRDRSGFVLTVWGSNNVLEETLAEALSAATDDFDTVTYTMQKDAWFVLSGYTGDDIVYLKYWVGPGSVNALRMEYPAFRKKEYDAVVTKIVRSFRPGDLESMH